MILHVFSQMKLLNPISGIASDMKYMRTGGISKINLNIRSDYVEDVLY